MLVIIVISCTICLIMFQRMQTKWGCWIGGHSHTYQHSYANFVMFYTLWKNVNFAWFFSNRLQTPQRLDHVLPIFHSKQCLVPGWVCIINSEKKTKIKIKVVLWYKTVDRIDICVELSILSALFNYTIFKHTTQVHVFKDVPLNGNSYSLKLHTVIK